MFFYNRETRLAATGRLNDDGGFVPLRNFDAGAGFGKWTLIVPVSLDGLLFFYNHEARTAATGKVKEDGNFMPLQNFDAAAGFGNWTHIVGFSDGFLFFYNREDRTAATGKVKEDGGFVPLQNFDAGAGFGNWTHIVSIITGGLLFFYSHESRLAATGSLDEDGRFVPLQNFDTGAGFGNWTHIAGFSPLVLFPPPPSVGRLFFYNRVTRTAATGLLNLDGGFVPLKNLDAGAGIGDWTDYELSDHTRIPHIVPGRLGAPLFFYNRENRTAATGRVGTDGGFVPLQKFDAGAGFGNWTHIVGFSA